MIGASHLILQILLGLLDLLLLLLLSFFLGLVLLVVIHIHVRKLTNQGMYDGSISGIDIGALAPVARKRVRVELLGVRFDQVLVRHAHLYGIGDKRWSGVGARNPESTRGETPERASNSSCGELRSARVC